MKKIKLSKKAKILLGTSFASVLLVPVVAGTAVACANGAQFNANAQQNPESGANGTSGGNQGQNPNTPNQPAKPDQGSGSQGTGGQSSGGQSSGSQGTGGQSSGSQGTGSQSSGSQGTGGQSSGSQGTGGQSSGSQGTGGQSSGSQGTSGQTNQGSTSDKGSTSGSTSGSQTTPSSSDAQMANSIKQAVAKQNGQDPQTAKSAYVITATKNNYDAIARAILNAKNNGFDSYGHTFSAQADTLIRMSLSNFMNWRAVNTPTLNGQYLDMEQIQFGLDAASYDAATKGLAAPANVGTPIPVQVNYNTIPGSPTITLYIGYGVPQLNQTVTVISPLSASQINATPANKKQAWTQVWNQLQKQVSGITSIQSTTGINFPFQPSNLANPLMDKNIPNLNVNGTPNPLNYTSHGAQEQIGNLNVNWISYQQIANAIVNAAKSVFVYNNQMNAWEAQQTVNYKASRPQIRAALYKKLGWTEGQTNSFTFTDPNNPSKKITVQIPANELHIVFGNPPAKTTNVSSVDPFNTTISLGQVTSTIDSSIPAASPAVPSTVPLEVHWITDYQLIPNISRIWVKYVQYRLQTTLGANINSAKQTILNQLKQNHQIAQTATINDITPAIAQQWINQYFVSSFNQTTFTGPQSAEQYVSNIWWPANITPFYNGVDTQVPNSTALPNAITSGAQINTPAYIQNVYNLYINPAFKTFGQNYQHTDPTSVSVVATPGATDSWTFSIELAGGQTVSFYPTTNNNVSLSFTYTADSYEAPNATKPAGQKTPGSIVNTTGWNSNPTYKN